MEPVFSGLTFTFEDDRFAYGEFRFVTLGVSRNAVVSIQSLNMKSTSSRSAAPRSAKSRSTVTKSLATKVVSRTRPRTPVDDHPEANIRHVVRGIVRNGLVPIERKTAISLRVYSDVLEWFKTEGDGYQTRINAVLRAYRDASVA